VLDYTHSSYTMYQYSKQPSKVD